MATEQSVMAVIRAARPTFRNSHDKVAFAIHASFLSAGFILHSTGPSAFVNDVLSSASTDEAGLENWNEVEDNYAFLYSNPDQGAQKVLVKCLVMNNKLLVDALKEGDSEPLHLEINVSDYAEENGTSNYSFKNLRNLVADVDKEILAILDGSVASSSAQPSSSDKGLRDDRDRSSMGVSNPGSPYVFPHPSGKYRVTVPPLPDSGSSDLFPGPGAGMYPSRGDFGGGSMLIGPHDPRFCGGNRRGVFHLVPVLILLVPLLFQVLSPVVLLETQGGRVVVGHIQICSILGTVQILFRLVHRKRRILYLPLIPFRGFQLQFIYLREMC